MHKTLVSCQQKIHNLGLSYHLLVVGAVALVPRMFFAATRPGRQAQATPQKGRIVGDDLNNFLNPGSPEKKQ